MVKLQVLITALLLLEIHHLATDSKSLPICIYKISGIKHQISVATHWKEQMMHMQTYLASSQNMHSLLLNRFLVVRISLVNNLSLLKEP